MTCSNCGFNFLDPDYPERCPRCGARRNEPDFVALAESVKRGLAKNKDREWAEQHKKG
jgi:hypothetical protein